MDSVRALRIGDRVGHPHDMARQRTLTKAGWEPPYWLATVSESPIPVPEGKVCVIADNHPGGLCFFYPNDLRYVEERGNRITFHFESPSKLETT